MNVRGPIECASASCTRAILGDWDEIDLTEIFGWTVEQQPGDARPAWYCGWCRL